MQLLWRKSQWAVLLLFLLLVATAGSAQDNADRAATLKKVYQQALLYNDLASATYATHEIISLGEEYKSWRDTLMRLYFSQERYGPAILVAEELSAEMPENQGLLEIQAVAWQRLGGVKNALELYERLAARNKDIYSLYQVATLQYRLGRVTECEATLTKITEHPKFGEAEISISVKDGVQVVPIEAAVLNIRGLLAMGLNKHKVANQFFASALKLVPDFELAMGNMQLNQQKMEEKGTAPVAQPEEE